MQLQSLWSGFTNEQYDYITNIIKNSDAKSVCELGTFVGTTAKHIWENIKNSDKKLYLVDNYLFLPEDKRQKFIEKLYRALIELLLRFEDDWSNDKIDKTKVMIVKFDRMMSDFEGLMYDILDFIDYHPSDKFISNIKKTAEQQRSFKSGHKYDLEKFGLTETLFFFAARIE